MTTTDICYDDVSSVAGDVSVASEATYKGHTFNSYYQGEDEYGSEVYKHEVTLPNGQEVVMAEETSYSMTTADEFRAWVDDR